MGGVLMPDYFTVRFKAITRGMLMRRLNPVTHPET